MTDDTIALRALLEKGSDTTLLREMIGFAAQRLMELETDTLCGGGRGGRGGCRSRNYQRGQFAPRRPAHAIRLRTRRKDRRFVAPNGQAAPHCPHHRLNTNI
ncbi:MAG: hypothetical protein WDN25_14620 [Acetobacteraceae bacterium]